MIAEALAALLGALLGTAFAEIGPVRRLFDAIGRAAQLAALGRGN